MVPTQFTTYRPTLALHDALPISAPASRPRFAADLIEQQRDRIDHARDLELAITGIAVTGLAPGADLRAAAPAREPRGGGPTEEQRMAEQRLNFAFDLGRDIGDHAAHLLDPARARGDRIEVVADRLLRSDEHTSELQSLMRISY